MTTTAEGIHAHDLYKTGLIPTDPARPVIEVETFVRLRPEVVIPTPDEVDHFAGSTFGLYTNDRFGICGPTSVCNLVRLVSKRLTGTQVTPSQHDCDDLYRRSGNPNFDPTKPGTEDNGVEMADMLSALLSGGVAGIKPVAYARSKDVTDATLERLVAVFGGCLWAVNLLEPQQAQTDLDPPKWDYKAGPEWGGHAIMDGKYRVESPTATDLEVISWEKDVLTTDRFRQKQLEEVWLVIFPWHLEHPAFLEGVDLPALADEYKALTGKGLPIPVTPPAPSPSPPPSPGGADANDVRLWEQIKPWAHAHHVGSNKRAALATLEWARAIGLE